MFENWEIAGHPVHAWRLMFLIGILPALLAVLIRRRLKEPERWQAVAADATKEQQAGLVPRIVRRSALAAQRAGRLGLAAPGVIGLWSLGFFTPDLIRSVLTETFKAEGMPAREIPGK